MCAVNSYVIEREIMPKGKIVGNEFILKDTGKAVDGVEIKDGRLTGMLYETNAMGLFTRPSLSTAQSLQLPRAFSGLCRRRRDYLRPGRQHVSVPSCISELRRE